MSDPPYIPPRNRSLVPKPNESNTTTSRYQTSSFSSQQSHRNGSTPILTNKHIPQHVIGAHRRESSEPGLFRQSQNIQDKGIFRSKEDPSASSSRGSSMIKSSLKIHSSASTEQLALFTKGLKTKESYESLPVLNSPMTPAGAPKSFRQSLMLLAERQKAEKDLSKPLQIDVLVMYALKKVDVAVSLDQEGAFISALTFYREAVMAIQKAICLMNDMIRLKAMTKKSKPHATFHPNFRSRRICRRDLKEFYGNFHLELMQQNILDDTLGDQLKLYRAMYLNRVNTLMTSLPLEAQIYCKSRPVNDHTSLWSRPPVSMMQNTIHPAFDNNKHSYHNNNNVIDDEDDESDYRTIFFSQFVRNVPQAKSIPKCSVHIPFWFLNAINESITSGTYVTPQVFIPRDIWTMKNVRISSVDAKVQALELLHSFSCKMQQLDLNQSIAILNELEILEEVIEKVKNVIKKKIKYQITSNVPAAGAATSDILSSDIPIFKDAPSVTEKRGLTPWSKSIEKLNSGKTEDISLYVSALSRHSKQANLLLDILLRSERHVAQNSNFADEHTHIVIKMKKISLFYEKLICGFVFNDLKILHDVYIKRTRNTLTGEKS